MRNRNPYRIVREQAGADLSLTSYAKLSREASDWMYKVAYGATPPPSPGLHSPQRAARPAAPIELDELLVDPALIEPLRAAGEALLAGERWIRVAAAWERSAKLLPPVAGEDAPPPGDVPGSPELTKRLKYLRRAIGLAAALTTRQTLAKARGRDASVVAWKALDVATLDLRNLTTSRPVAAAKLRQQQLAAIGQGQAPADPVKVAADQALAWPPVPGDRVVQAQARMAGVTPEAMAALLDLSAANLDGTHMVELQRAGLLERDPSDPTVYRRSPRAWSIFERAVLRSTEDTRPAPAPPTVMGGF